MRLRSNDNVLVDNCYVQYCLRGVRIQDCSTLGRVANCRVFRTLEAAFYLASGSYTGSAGCNNFVISNCSAQEIFHNGYLVIGGKQNSIIGCTGSDLCSSAVVAWHSQDLTLTGCSFSRVVLKTYIGIGKLGDSYGAVYHSNKDDIADTGGYMLTAVNNSFIDVGVGRASDSYTFYFGDSNTSPVSFRVIIDGNHSTANEDVKNIDSVPLVTSQYPAPAAGGLSGATVDRVMVTSGTGDATASDVSVTTLSYLDATSSVQTQIDNRAKTTDSTVFDENVTVNGYLYVYNNDGQDSLFQMQRQGGFSTVKWEHRGSYSRMKLGPAKYHMHDDGRHSFAGQFVQVPTSDAVPAANAANSKGGFYLDTSTSPPVMKYHNGTSWQTIATV